jgi:2-succinyl-6-hydroxy-2,4-cyclohexadiene-1-carboxylate synthase
LWSCKVYADQDLFLNGMRYKIRRAGRVGKPPLLLLHGFTGSRLNWAQCMTDLQDDADLVAVDLPGHGDTEPRDELERHRMPKAAADMASLIAHMFARPAHVLGYSMGARLALHIGDAHPDWVRSLVLESGSPGIADPAERAMRVASDEALAARIERDGVAAFVDTWEALPMWASQEHLPVEERRRLRALRLRNSPTGLANSLRGMGTGAQESLWHRLDKLTMPVCCIHGVHDGKFLAIAQAMCAANPAFQTLPVTGAGHAVHLEAPDSYATILREWLTSMRIPASE